MIEKRENLASLVKRFDPYLCASDPGARAFDESFALFLTRRCPLRCAHCIVSSHPDRPDPPRDTVLRVARQAAAREALRHVCITGGEPFLRPELLRDVIALLAGAGKEISVITSAHWAATAPRARRMLEQVLGDGREMTLWISLDPHHSAFLPAANYVHAVEAASSLGLRPRLTATYRRDPHEAIAFIDETLPQRTVELCGGIRLQPLFLQGRGEHLPDSDGFSQALPAGVCGSCVPHANEDGTVFACCSLFDAPEGHPLRLGDATHQNLDGLLDRADRDQLIQAIRTLGPKRLAEMLPDAMQRHAKRHVYLPHDICSLCSRIMGDPNCVAALRGRLAEDIRLQRRIALLRLVRYGETAMLTRSEDRGHATTRFAVPDRISAD